MTRIVTALILAPLFISLVWFGSFELFTAVVVLSAAICFTEFSQMALNRDISVYRTRGMIAAVILPLAFLSSLPVLYMAATLIMISIFLVALPDSENGFSRASFTFLGILYIGISFSAPVLVRQLPDGEKLLLLICCAVWGADIGAYYVGRAIGKTKLAPAISPGKTVEGSIGGVFFSVASSMVFAHFLFREVGIPVVVAAGVIGGIIGPVGDLSESMMKRYFGVKDSGTILPGHGGLLDRADALMFAIPVFYVFLVSWSVS